MDRAGEREGASRVRCAAPRRMLMPPHPDSAQGGAPTEYLQAAYAAGWFRSSALPMPDRLFRWAAELISDAGTSSSGAYMKLQ